MPIDITKTTRRATPSDWSDKIKTPQIDVLPLVTKPDGRFSPGWCTYSDDFTNLPDVEMMCGGINSKTPTAAALWRQGNLLHFGFEQSPAEFNLTGKAMLINAIVYISRFTEDRPIAVTPSVFAGKVALPRRYVASVVQREDRPMDWLKSYLAPATLASFPTGNRAAARVWYEGVKDFLHPGPDLLLTVDEDLRALGVAFNRPEFFSRCIAALWETGEARDRALRLLQRYTADGPGTDAAAWAAWWPACRDYLFFSEDGDYRWYVDTLAKKRGVSTVQLRGPARADGRRH